VDSYFFLVLAAILVSTLIAAQKNSVDVSIGLLAVIVAIASAPQRHIGITDDVNCKLAKALGKN